MIETVIIFCFWWLAMFCAGYALPTFSKRAILSMWAFYFGGLMIYFYQLYGGIFVLSFSSPSSAEIGILGLFFIPYLSSSLGGGYLVGAYAKKGGK